MEIYPDEIIRPFARLSVCTTPNPGKGPFRELKSQKCPGGACPRTHLQAFALGARLGNQSVLSPRSAPDLYGLLATDPCALNTASSRSCRLKLIKN